MKGAALAVALAVAFAAVDAVAGAVPDSGISGLVLIGPTCPVVIEGQPCPDEPYQATIRVRSAKTGRVVATVRSGKRGRFRIRLAAGRYVLEPLSPNAGGPPFAGRLTVRVHPHRFARVTVLYDSGIR